MKVALIILSILFINTIYAQQDQYKIIVDGKEVWLDAKTGQIVNKKETQTNTTKTVNKNKFIANPNATIYKIVAGDTLYGIARKTNTKFAELLALNDIEKNTILKIGDRLNVKPKKADSQFDSSFYHTVVKGDTLYSLARKYNTTVENLQKINDLESYIIGLEQKLRVK